MAHLKNLWLTLFIVPTRADVIQAGRESVAESGLFITKKRYAVLIYDLEGHRTDKGEEPRQSKSNGS